MERRRELLFRTIDCVRVLVPDLEAGLAFYRDRLGHQLIWRTATAGGLRMIDTTAEIVLQTERAGSDGSEVDLLVVSADAAAEAVVAAGGSVIEPPFDIAIGRRVVVADPWGTPLVLLDLSRGPLVTGDDGSVVEPCE